MPAWLNPDRYRGGIAAGALAIALFANAALHASEITILDVQTQVMNEIIHVDINLELAFSQEAIDALHSGIPIVFEVDIEISRVRRYWFNANVVQSKHRYQMSYHALSEQYLITDLVTGDRRAFLDLDDAMAAMEAIRGLPVAERTKFETDGRYAGAVQVGLDIEALPAPMRPLAYFSRAWRVSSSWFEWKIAW